MFNQTRNIAAKFGAKAATGAGLLLSSALALAQDAGVGTTATAAVGTAKTDATTVALALLGLSVAVWGIMKIVGMFGRR